MEVHDCRRTSGISVRYDDRNFQLKISALVYQVVAYICAEEWEGRHLVSSVQSRFILEYFQNRFNFIILFATLFEFKVLGKACVGHIPLS